MFSLAPSSGCGWDDDRRRRVYAFDHRPLLVVAAAIWTTIAPQSAAEGTNEDVEQMRVRIPGTDGIGRRCAAAASVAMAVALVLASAGAFGPRGDAAASLQDATDPGSIACTLDVPEFEAVAEASPVPVASPVAEGTPAPGRPADPATAAEIEHLVRTLASCLTQGRSETVAQLVTERYLGALYGGGGRLSREDYLALAPELPAVSIAVSDVADVRVQSDRRANADVVTVIGNQLEHGRWTFVRGPADDADRRWQVDIVTPLPVEAPPDAVRVRVEMTEYAYSLSRAEVAGPSLVLAGTNSGEEDHEILVLRLDRGVSTDALLREPGPGLPRGVTFIGQVTVPAGAEAELVLVGLPPGSYAIVCLLPTRDGTPHLALGMRARLRVTGR
jgi:hypothetical protein